MTDAVFTISKHANCSALDLLNENVDIFFTMVNYHFERLSLEDENKTESAVVEPVPTAKNKLDFWNF